jgi:hypothetical protein
MMGIRTGVAGMCLCAAACSFSQSNGRDLGEGPDASTVAIDAPINIDIDAPIAPPDTPPQQVTCTTSDPALKVCIEFEDTPLAATARDGAGQHDATLDGVTAFARDIPVASHAVALTGTTSSITLPDTTDFNVQAVTLGAWVRRTATPSSNGRFGIVDIGRRNAGLAIDSGGNVVCFVKTATTLFFRTGGGTATNEWAFAACTYDAPELCAYSFRNGSGTPSVTCGNTDGAALDTSDANGAVGALLDLSDGTLISRMVGSIDAVRVYNRALTEAELRTSAGL